MSNYISNLQDEVAKLKAEAACMKDGMTNLRTYLASDKFHNDTTVQVKDVLLRLDEAESNASRAIPKEYRMHWIQIEIMLEKLMPKQLVDQISDYLWSIRYRATYEDREMMFSESNIRKTYRLGHINDAMNAKNIVPSSTVIAFLKKHFKDNAPIDEYEVV